MGKWSRKIETVGNLLVICVAVLLIGVIAHKYIFATHEQRKQNRITPTIGKIVNFPNANRSAQRTVILALQTTCRFCIESAPFYQRLVEESKGKNIKIIAVFPQPVEESTTHLSQLGVTGVEVKQAPISMLETDGTPTLIITNQEGRITKYWLGKLSPEKEEEVIKEINS